MEMVTQVQNLDEAVCISLHANALEKGMNSSMGRLGSLVLVMQPVKEK